MYYLGQSVLFLRLDLFICIYHSSRHTMSKTHKPASSGFSEFVNVFRVEVSGGNDSFDREQKLERHPLLSDTRKNKAKNRSGNANTCELTHLHWMCFWSQQAFLGAVAKRIIRAHYPINTWLPLEDSGEGSKGLGALCNVAYKKMLQQTLIVLTVPLNNQQRAAPGNCIDVFARYCM